MFKKIKEYFRHKRFFGKALTQTGLCILKEEGTVATSQLRRTKDGEDHRTTIWIYADNLRELDISIVEIPSTADSDRALAQTTITLYNDQLDAIPLYIGKTFQGNVLGKKGQHVVAVRIGIIGQYGMGVKSVPFDH